jgi:NADPH-dependent 2,4-dienoyl-CoA reductase/sulfur reductase-like enzyme
VTVHQLWTSRPAYGPRDRILVVGGGAAGWAAAGELRRQGFAGDVVVVSAEPVLPYDRTACSKGLLDGHQRPQDTTLDVRGHPGVRWRPGLRVTGLDPRGRRVVLDTGEVAAYDGMVVATGTRPALPTHWPTGRPGLHLLHDLSDAWALRAALGTARRVAVVGGGLTGCEVACAVTVMARQAILVNSQPYLMPRSVGEQIGTLVTAAHRAAGMDLRLGRSVTEAEHRRGMWRLLLDSGDSVVADVVVVAAGEKPDVDWLSGGAIDVSDGVLCDESLRVVGVDGIVAAGSLARWPNLRYGTTPGRVGQWISAVEQGQAAARTLLAGDREVSPVTLLPRFWSEQNGLRIQVCGRQHPRAEVLLTELRPRRRDTARAGVVASYSENGRLVGLGAVNAPRAFAVACRTLLTEPVPARPAVPVDVHPEERRLRLVR